MATMRTNQDLERRFGRWGFLAGWPKPAIRSTVSVDPPPLAAGQEATVTVTVPGARPGNKYRVVMLPNPALPVGLHATSSKITANDTVAVGVVNLTAGPLDAAPSNWTALLFKRATGGGLGLLRAGGERTQGAEGHAGEGALSADAGQEPVRVADIVEHAPVAPDPKPSSPASRHRR